MAILDSPYQNIRHRGLGVINDIIQVVFFDLIISIDEHDIFTFGLIKAKVACGGNPGV